jgi:hypothetical protein
MIAGLDAQGCFALGYAVFLSGAAAALEVAARHSYKRAHAYATRGFRYHRQTDHWECPVGQRLTLYGSDPALRVILYRAPAHACNRCHSKSGCTDSDEGRTVERPQEQWLASALGRFHRGLSLVLLVLAAIILLAEMVRRHESPALWVLGGLLALLAIQGGRLLSAFRSSQSWGS